MVLIPSCHTEDPILNLEKEDGEIVFQKAKKSKVPVCHKLGNGNYNTIHVDESAVPGHLAHGDFLFIDNDGDGYYQDNPCVDEPDCDDNVVAINYTEATCEEASCCWCDILDDYNWNVYLAVDSVNAVIGELASIILLDGETVVGSATIFFNDNPRFQAWLCGFVDPETGSPSISVIAEEQAIQCMNIICAKAAELGLTGAQTETGESISKAALALDGLEGVMLNDFSQ